jgi:bis(5'-nucleosyl)-tetraphosphatase (symmetrical)
MALLHRQPGETILMVHAGVLPAWSASQTMALAAEVQAVLRSPDLGEFLHQMYGNEPARWDESLRGAQRLRVVVNALTRLRFCTPDGQMEFDAKDGADTSPPGYLPWFEVPGRHSADVTVAFGHWSTLGPLKRRDLLALDTGCVWGGALSAVRLAPSGAHPLIQVRCQQAQVPGA